MRRILWEEDASKELEAAVFYIALSDRAAALRVERRVLGAVALLARHPIGRPSKMSCVSQKLVLKTPYLIVYRATDTTLTVLRVLHQSRDWPPKWDAD